MKKILSMLLVVIMITSVTTITAFSATNDAGDKDYLFFDDFDAIHRCNTGDTTYYYDELYYHYVDENDPDSEIDWSIVYALLYAGNPSLIKGMISDRVLTSSMNVCYTYGWALYDAKTKEFISINKVDIDKYDGFEEALSKVKVGNPLGDADLDGVLTISDATYIQRVLANLDEFSIYDDLSIYDTWGKIYDNPLYFISDIDGDGNRTVLDATTIQMKLAKK